MQRTLLDHQYKVGEPKVPVIGPEVSYHNIHFVRCTFHPNCKNIKFTDCNFSHCHGLEHLELTNN